MYCKTCGSRIEDAASFCSVCGTPVNKNEEAPKRSAEAGSKPIDRHRIIGIAAVIVAGLLLVAILASLLGGRSWRSTVNGVVTDYYKGNIEKVVDYMPTKRMKKTGFGADTDLKGYKASLRALYDTFGSHTKGTLKKYEIVSTEKFTADILDTYSAFLNKKVSDGMNVNLRLIRPH